MNSSIAIRLLWKEYRAQRGLWLALAGGCCLIQSMIAFTLQRSPDAFLPAMATAIVLTLFYAAGAGAMTFAIEREEGTHIRPVMLGHPAALTLTVKTLFGIVATGLLLTTTVCFGVAVTQVTPDILPAFFSKQWNSISARLPALITILGFSYLGALLWGMFFSLLSRTVVLAMGLTVVAMLASFGLLGSIVADAPAVPAGTPPMAYVLLPGIVAGGLVLLLFIGDFLLTDLWLRRVFFDRQPIRLKFRPWRFRVSRSQVDGSLTIRIGGEDRTAFEVLETDLTAIQPPPRVSLSLLYSTWGSRRWRHLRFLCWREAAQTRRLYVVSLALTVIMAVLCIPTNQYPQDFEIVACFFSFATCVACGVMAFRSEQTDQAYRKLTELGLTSNVVWLSKHLVWLTRTFVAYVVVMGSLLLVRSVPYGLDTTNTLFGQWTPHTDSALQQLGLPLGRLAIMVLVLYAIGQACSQLIRTALVSFSVAFLLAFTTVMWAVACGHVGAPATLAILPIGIGCMLVSWWRTPHWMLDDRRPRTWIASAASMVAGLAIAYVGTGLFRIYQIPWTPPAYTQAADVQSPSELLTGNPRDGLTTGQRNQLLSPLTAVEKETFAIYQRAAQLEWNRSEPDSRASETAPGVQATRSPACAELSPGTTDYFSAATACSTDVFGTVVGRLHKDARRHLDAGDPKKALDRLCQALVACRHAAGRGLPDEFSNSHQLTALTLDPVRKWAAHNSTEQALIDRAIEEIDEHRRQMLPLEVVSAANAALVRNAFNAGRARLVHHIVPGSRAQFSALMTLQFPGEMTRSHRILNQIEARHASVVAAYRQEVSSIAPRPPRSWIEHFSAAAQSIAEQWGQLPPAIASPGYVDFVGLCRQDLTTECDVRATRILLSLMQLGRRPQAWPDNLESFDQSLHDPWSNQPFDWYPDGLEHDLLIGESVVVPANTPFLLSTHNGSVMSEFSLRRVDEQQAPSKALMRRGFHMIDTTDVNGLPQYSVWPLVIRNPDVKETE